MSTLSFNCNHCGQHFEAPHAMAGQNTECPNCKQAVRVPLASNRTGPFLNWWSVAALAVGLLALLIASYAAFKNSTNAFQDPEIARLRSEVDELKQQAGADKLLKMLGEFAYLTPGAEGYSTLKYDLGILTASIADVTDFANGSKVTLNFGNPLSSTINGLKLTIDYGEVGADGTAQNDSARTKEVTLTESLRPGSWTKVPVVLEGLPASKLGFVRIRNLSHTGISLSTSR